MDDSIHIISFLARGGPNLVLFLLCTIRDGIFAQEIDLSGGWSIRFESPGAIIFPG